MINIRQKTYYTYLKHLLLSHSNSVSNTRYVFNPAMSKNTAIYGLFRPPFPENHHKSQFLFLMFTCDYKLLIRLTPLRIKTPLFTTVKYVAHAEYFFIYMLENLGPNSMQYTFCVSPPQPWMISEQHTHLTTLRIFYNVNVCSQNTLIP